MTPKPVVLAQAALKHTPCFSAALHATSTAAVAAMCVPRPSMHRAALPWPYSARAVSCEQPNSSTSFSAVQASSSLPTALSGAFLQAGRGDGARQGPAGCKEDHAGPVRMEGALAPADGAWAEMYGWLGQAGGIRSLLLRVGRPLPSCQAGLA